MCKISDQLKLCSCEMDRGRHSINHWVYYRIKEGSHVTVFGEIMESYSEVWETDKNYNDFLEKILNERNCFDKEMQSQENDRLELHITIEGKRNVFGFEFENKKWHYHEYGQVNWDENRKQIQTGKIENVLVDKQD